MNAALTIFLYAGMALLAAGTFCALIGPTEPAPALLGIGALTFVPAATWWALWNMPELEN
jgi:hypothetical protein